MVIAVFVVNFDVATIFSPIEDGVGEAETTLLPTVFP